MADKESPPWLLGVFTFAMLCLVFGSLARTRGTPAQFVAVEGAGPSPAAAPARPGPARLGAPQPASRSRAPLHVNGSPPAAPLHASAAPTAEEKRNKLNAPFQQGGDNVIDDIRRDGEALLDEGRSTLRPRQLHPGRRAEVFRATVLPWVTECAFVLCLGIILGFLTRIELAVMATVAACFSLLLIYLEWRDYTDIQFNGLLQWAKAAIWNPVSSDTLRMLGGKVAALTVGVIGWFMGTKG